MSVLPSSRPALMAVAIAALVCSPQARAQIRSDGPAHVYNLPAQPLGSALASIASTSGQQISMDADLVRGLNAPAVQGRLSAQQAAGAALAGSGLELVLTGSGNWSVRRVVAQRADTAAGSGPVHDDALAAVTVTAQAQRTGVTEGSGSYTTAATSAATGLSLSLRDTPQSVSVMTRQRIDDQGLQTVVDVLKNAPGIATTQLDSERYTLYSRGFAIDNYQYDGMPYASQNGDTELDPIIYDRIEIVRGATGLLTGAGEPSASINLVRKRASSKVFTGSVAAGAASWDDYRLSADLSTPLTQDGRVRARLVAARESKKSFIQGYGRDRSTLYAVVDADLTPATTVSMGFSHQTSDVKGATYGGLPIFYSDGSPIDWSQHGGRGASIWPRWSSEDVETDKAFIHVDHLLDNGWTAQATASHGKNRLGFTRLFPWGLPDPDTGLMTSSPSRVRFPAEGSEQSAGLRLSGGFDWGGRSHEAMVGLSYSRQERLMHRIGAADAPAALSVFEWSSYPEPAAWGSSVISEQYDRRQTGAFGAVRLSVSDPLKLIVGGRFNRWERSGVGYAGRNPYDSRQNRFTPYAGLVYALSHSLSLYGSYTSIFNPQTYRDRDGAFLDPAQGDSYETGLKGAFLDGRLNASLAVFRIQQDNVAQADPGATVPGTTTQAYFGAKGVTSKGVELELNGEITPRWSLAFHLAHFSATDSKGQDVSTAAPRSVVRLFTAYRLSGELHKLTVGGGINWQSRVHNPTGSYDTDNPVGEYSQGAYALVGLMGRYQLSRDLSLQFNIDNLFDRQYQTAVNFAERIVWGMPRSYRATLNYRF